MKLDDTDFRLSMRMGRRPRGKPDEPTLRSLLIHRLSDTAKLVFRRSLRYGQISALCEKCNEWTVSKLAGDMEELKTHWSCPKCERVFRLELAVYEEVDP